jgi:LacI family transcriptional regulator
MTALSGRRRRPRGRAGARVTLAHIARRAGVSPITASRALARSELVAPATLARVRAVAAELGYAPNLLARGLVQNRTSTVGVVVLELANPFFAPMLAAIQAAAARRGFLVVIGESGRDEATEREYVERFQQLRIGGVVVTPAGLAGGHLAAARKAGVPTVVMARRWADGDYVTADNLEGGRLVARHLLARGYRAVGLVQDERPDSASQSRVEGFCAALADAGVGVPEPWTLRTAGTRIEHGLDAADRLLALGARPRALFVTTDRMAMGVVHRLLARGLRVPEDVAVVGYDDIAYASCAQVPLTTVAIPMRRLGEVAAEILFDRIERRGPAGHRQVLLPPALVVRASCP